MSKMTKSRAIGAVVALALTGAALSGCVYYPNQYAYGYGNGYEGGYYGAPAVVVAPAPVVVGGWWGWGGRGGWDRGGWGHGGGHWR